MKKNRLPVALLKRRELAEAEPISEDITQMLDEVSAEDPLDSFFEETGYCPPSVVKLKEEKQARLAQARSAQEKAKNPLRMALRASGIKPFTPESIRKYKYESIRNKFQFLTTDVNSALLNSNSASCAFMCISGFVVNAFLYSIIGSIITIVFSLSVPLTIPFATIILIISLVGCLSGKLFFAYAFLGSIPGFFELFGPSQYEWTTKPLRDYQKDIPRTVLETAKEIRFHCPGVCFEIEEIDKKPDPFLVAWLDGERFYVEVWAEPDFKGERLA